MRTLLRVLAGLAGLFFLVLVLAFLLAPSRLTMQFALLPAGNTGYNTLRGDFGGFFLGMAAFALTGAIRRSGRWLTVPALFLGLVVLGRLTSLVFDGASSDAVRMMVVEVALLTVLVLAIRSLGSTGLPQASAMRAWPRVAIAIGLLVAMGLGVTFIFQRQLGLALVGRGAASGLQKQSWLGALPDGLHAGLCGSGSPLADPNRAGPCVFVIAGPHVYIVDAGEGSPRKMTLMGLPPARIDGIFLTHFHSDHIGGLGEMLLQRWAGGNHADRAPVFGPPGVDAVVQGFNVAYEQDTGYRIAHHGVDIVPPSGAGGLARPFPITSGSDASLVVLEQDGLRVTAFPVQHAPANPAVGYRFDYAGRSVVVSGDTAPSLVLEQQARGVDVLFHEGLQTAMVSILGDALTRNSRQGAAKIMRDIPSYHTTPEDAARLAERAGVGHLVFYHTIPPLPYSLLNAAFLGDAPSLYRGPITVSNDGTLVSLPAGSKAISLRELL